METIPIDLLETILCVPHVKIELADHYALIQYPISLISEFLWDFVIPPSAQDLWTDIYCLSYVREIMAI